MKLSYKITQDDYKKLIEYTLKEQARTPRARFFFLLSTVGILILVTLLILTNPFTMRQSITLAAAAVLAAAANFYSSRSYHKKAENVFNQMMKKRTIQPSFWDEHSLEPKEDGLLMTYGKTEYLLPWYNLIAPELDADFLYIKNVQGSVVEGVPNTAIAADEVRKLMEIFEKNQTT